jgi:hypothetical protein
VTRRAQTSIGVGLLATALALIVTAALVRTTPDTSATSATITRPSSTAAPITDPAVLATAGSAPPSSTAGSATSSAASTVPLSPLAELVGPPQQAAAPVLTPVAAPLEISIDDLGMSAPVVPVGVASDGQLEIPDEHHVGWYRLGAAPGQPGATVLAAHVNWHHVDGPFVRLRELDPGALVSLTLDDGATRTYQVVERHQFSKDALPADEIWTHEGPETLVLITCGGSFNPDIHRYRDNIVVFAVPIA